MTELIVGRALVGPTLVPVESGPLILSGIFDPIYAPDVSIPPAGPFGSALPPAGLVAYLLDEPGATFEVTARGWGSLPGSDPRVVFNRSLDDTWYSAYGGTGIIEVDWEPRVFSPTGLAWANATGEGVWLEGSVNSINWLRLVTYEGSDTSGHVEFAPVEFFRYLRVFIGSTSDHAQVSEIEFYGTLREPPSPGDPDPPPAPPSGTIASGGSAAGVVPKRTKVLGIVQPGPTLTIPDIVLT